MTNELTVVELLGANRDGEPRYFTVADGASISVGTLLQLTDPRTASQSAWQAPVAGVALEEKVPNDGTTRISGWTQGIFEATASKAILIGEKVIAAGPQNMVFASSGAITGASNALICGTALEHADPAERFSVRLNL